MAPTWNFARPHNEGGATTQAHVDFARDTYEREIGREGFFGAASHVYHRNPPNAWSSIEGAAKPRAFNPASTATPAASPWDAQPLMHNAHVRVRYWRAEGSMDHLVRNGDGDELVFIHQGAGSLFCDFGHLPFESGDYLVLPRGTMWRIESDGPVEALLVESTNASYRLPDRGMLGRHALFDPGVLARPELDGAFRDQRKAGPWQVRVKRRNAQTVVTFPFNPLDAVSWKGDLYPVRLNVRDFRPVTSHRVHLPPSAHTTFLSDRFVICTLAPRPMESEPGAMKLPFFHSNDDYDEVVFYHRGRLRGRSAIVGEGTMTFHPSGVVHGPHPEALPHMFEHPLKMLESYSVMIDTRDALEIADLPAGTEIAGYAESWTGSIAVAPDAQTVP